MRSSLSRLGFSLLVLMTSPSLFAAVLQSMDASSLPGDRVELKLTFDQPVTVPKGYTIEQPARIALDFPGVNSAIKNKTRDVATGSVRSVTVVEANERTRLILNLSKTAPYSTRAEGNNLFVVVGENEGNRSVSASTEPRASRDPMHANPTQNVTTPVITPVKTVLASGEQPAVKVPPLQPRPISQASIKPMPKPVSNYTGQRTIRNIDFQRGAQGEGNVVIQLSDNSVSPDIQEQGGKIRVNFPKTTLPESLRVQLDVKDFATPVQLVNATSSSDGASIVIEPNGYFDYLSYQTDDKLTISVKPLTKTETDKRRSEDFAYTGEKLSLNFQDIDVRSVLQLIADFTNLNLVASDTVQGNITLRLQNVPWDQALDLVLKTKGLDKRKIGNVLLIAPADEIAARERQELEATKQIAELAPLKRELIQVNYAKATDLANLFKSVAKEGDDARGSVTVDDRTNSIVAFQTHDKLEELRRIVVQLDIPVRQVMIEARIVEASVDYDKALGVRWGGNYRTGNWDFYGKDGARTIEDNTIYRPGSSTIGNYQATTGTAPTPFVDMGVLNSTSGMGIGFLSKHVLLDLQLSAMEKTGNGEIVSQPKVVTSDKETAKILRGTEIPYQEASSSGATSVSFKDAVLSLEVTPQITPDNSIIMEVKVNKDEPDYANSVLGVPPIRTNQVNAKVLVADGETIVIGGVFSTTQTKGTEKVPFLGDVPFLGQLFRRDVVTDKKQELLIFLTPRILNSKAMAVQQ